MKFSIALFAAIAIIAAPFASAELRGADDNRELTTRRRRNLKLTVTNIAWQQPFSQFFVMVHNDDITPLYTMGGEASVALEDLAEGGSAEALVDMYRNMRGVRSAVAVANPDSQGSGEAGPLFGGESFDIPVTVTRRHPYVTIATMAITTNDCFMALNGVSLQPRDVVFAPGLDSGTERNDEDCDNIPGPPCGGEGFNESREGGEGFVHVHRGFHGLLEDEGGLSASGYDWRNPMMKVSVSEYDD